MTLAASSQRSQIIRSKFRSVLQLRIHRRYQDPSLSGSFTAFPASDPDPWISASGPALAPRAQAPALPSSPTPFLVSPGVSLPELEYCPWRSLKVSELRQQLRLRGLPVSGTKSMLLERMRGGAPTRERSKPRREDSPADAQWPRFRPKALAAARRQGPFKQRPTSHPPPPPRAAETLVTAPAPAPARSPAPARTPSSAPATAALTLEEELQEAIRRAQVRGEWAEGR
ncbi:hypothetical protein MC885_012412 [Smutsia gigantea]|nr:hypothetical protein MC885_012412 [Smutsia gigantea]